MEHINLLLLLCNTLSQLITLFAVAECIRMGQWNKNDDAKCVNGAGKTERERKGEVIDDT